MPVLDIPADAVIPPRRTAAPAPGERFPPHSPRCHGCADVAGGLGMEAWAQESLTVHARFRARADQMGGPGVLHGGVTLTALDEALGFVPPLVCPGAVTARLETDFRRPVPTETDVWVVAELEGLLGRKVWVRGTAHLHAPDGPVVATARGLYLTVDAQHFLRHGRPEDLEAVGAPPEAVRAARSGGTAGPTPTL